MPHPIDMTPIFALPVGEQIEIAHTLYESVPESERSRFELTEAMKEELDRRLQDARDNPGDCMPWEVVQRETLARVNGSGAEYQPPPITIDMSPILALRAEERWEIADAIYANFPAPPPGMLWTGTPEALERHLERESQARRDDANTP